VGTALICVLGFPVAIAVGGFAFSLVSHPREIFDGGAGTGIAVVFVPGLLVVVILAILLIRTWLRNGYKFWKSIDTK
jgi:hypothetical protein